jgi:hypothetical protein
MSALMVQPLMPQPGFSNPSPRGPDDTGLRVFRSDLAVLQFYPSVPPAVGTGIEPTIQRSR